MVYRIPVNKKNWLVAYYRKSFLIRSLTYTLCMGGVSFVAALPMSWTLLLMAVMLAVLIPVSVIAARNYANAVARAPRTCTHDYFLTLTDAGIMMECPEEGKSSYYPWNDACYAVAGKDVLMVAGRRAKRTYVCLLLNIDGLPQEKRRELLAECAARRGREGEGHVPAPSLGGSVLSFSGTQRQSVEIADHVHRPSTRSFVLTMVALSILICCIGSRMDYPTRAGYFIAATLLLLFLCVKRALFPGVMSRKFYAFRHSLEAAGNGVCFRWESGRWSCMRRRGIRWQVFRLPHALCLQEQVPGIRCCLHGYADADSTLPDFLPAPVPAPGNRRRALALALVLLLSCAVAYYNYMRTSDCGMYDDDLPELPEEW